MSRAATPIGKAAGVGPHQSRLAATGGGAVKISRLVRGPPETAQSSAFSALTSAAELD